MHRINLFSDTSRFGKYKQYAYLTKIVTLLLVSVSFVTLLTLLVLLYIQQGKYNDLNAQIPRELRTEAQDTDTLAKTAYAYNKLKVAGNVYFNSPEYYKQYKYLLDLLSRTGSFSIDVFSLSDKNIVELSVTSAKLTEVFSLITKFNSDEVKRYFVNLKVGSVTLKSEKDAQGASLLNYSVLLNFQFNPSFNEADI